MRIRRAAFERLVGEAIETIPDELLDRLENVEIVIERRPARELLEDLGMDPEEETLFGLYQGTPISERSSRYGGVLPDKITIFQWPIEQECETEEEMVEEIRRTVVHEIAHHFGIDDDRIDELGY